MNLRKSMLVLFITVTLGNSMAAHPPYRIGWYEIAGGAVIGVVSVVLSHLTNTETGIGVLICGQILGGILTADGVNRIVIYSQEKASNISRLAGAVI